MRLRGLAMRMVAGAWAGAALWLSFGRLALADADAVQRVGVLPSPWLLAIFLVVGIAFATVLRFSASAGAPLFLTLAIALPWLPFRIPDSFLIWTGPAVVLVWAAVAMCILAGVGDRVIQMQLATIIRHPKGAPLLAAALAFVTFLGVRLGQEGIPTGDEPHYLVIADSLLQDGDLKVANNYSSGDYLRYYEGVLRRPHLSAATVTGQTVYSVHAPGVPAIVAPALGLGGYWAVVVWVATLVAVGAGLVWKAAYTFTENAGAAWFGWATVTLTSPVALHGTLIYPDPLAGVMLAAGSVALACASASSQTISSSGQRSQGELPWTFPGLFALGLAVGILPWLHTRLALPAAFLGLVIVARVVQNRCKTENLSISLATFALPVVVSVTSWLGMFLNLYGTFNPAAAYGSSIPLDISRVPINMLALIVDQQFGLVPNGPVHLLWLPAFWSVFKRDRRLAIELLLIVAPYALASSGYTIWWAGGSPPARFLVPVVFPIGLAMAALWTGQRQTGRIACLVLLGASLLITGALAFGGDGTLAYNSLSTARARWLDWLSPLVDLSRGFPSYFRAAAVRSSGSAALIRELIAPAVLWGAALFIGWVVWRRIVIRHRVESAGAVAMMCLIVVLMAGVEATWLLRGGRNVLATRGQLGLLSADPQFHSLGLQLPRLLVISPQSVYTRLALRTSTLDRSPEGSLLFLQEVPPGEYSIRVTRSRFARGEILLRIGTGSVPVKRWSLVEERIDNATIDLPVVASLLTITGDQEAQQSVQSIVLVPVRRPESGAIQVRARDAARYGPAVVYVVDRRVWIEPSGFWVSGRRQADVFISMDTLASDTGIELEVSNVAIPNRVRLKSDNWSAERHLRPGERWLVRFPILAGESIALTFQVDDGIRVGERLHGVFVKLR